MIINGGKPDMIQLVVQPDSFHLPSSRSIELLVYQLISQNLNKVSLNYYLLSINMCYFFLNLCYENLNVSKKIVHSQRNYFSILNNKLSSLKFLHHCIGNGKICLEFVILELNCVFLFLFVRS